MNYTIDYFIEKFEAIPEDNWITGKYYDPEVGCCALGWASYDGITVTDEVIFFSKLFQKNNLVASQVNDNLCSKYRQPTPKQRILAALRDIKNSNA